MFGADGGAEYWAVIASLIETCKLNNIEPLGYLADGLARNRQRPPAAEQRRTNCGVTNCVQIAAFCRFPVPIQPSTWQGLCSTY